MKCSVILISLVLVLVCCDDRELARLQIGVKKRIDNCEIRSKKGDTLNVHYVVSMLPQDGVFCYILLNEKKCCNMFSDLGNVRGWYRV